MDQNSDLDVVTTTRSGVEEFSLLQVSNHRTLESMQFSCASTSGPYPSVGVPVEFLESMREEEGERERA